MNELTETQLAYIAGIIDGEGCLACQKQIQKRGKTPRYALRLSFVMTTPEPLETIGSWIGVLPRWYPATDLRRQARIRLDLPKNLACDLLQKCLPYLILKKEAAQLSLRIESVRQEYSPTRRHFGSQSASAMPSIAIEKMEELHKKLSATRCNKRPERCRIRP